MWYYFEHTDASHTMVIVDSNDAIPELLSTPLNASHLGPLVYHSEAGGVADREHIFDLAAINRVRTGAPHTVITITSSRKFRKRWGAMAHMTKILSSSTQDAMLTLLWDKSEHLSG